MEYKDYYKIPISMSMFWVWLVIAIIFTVISMGVFFFFLIIPIVVFFQLKNKQYLYNDKELLIREGLVFKVRRNIAMNKIEEINVRLKFLNIIVQASPISLNNIKKLDEEADKFIEVWNKNR